MRALMILATVALAGCAMATQLEGRGAEGYAALRFVETVRLAGAVGNTWEFPAGTVLTGDRRREADGALLYCGPMTIRDLGAETRPMCVIREGNTLRINAEYLREGFVREIPPGAIEEARLR